MPTIHDETWDGSLTATNLKNYRASDPSVINRAGGAKNLTPLAAACWRGHLEVVKMLLAEGADPNALSPPSRTPLYFVTTQTHHSSRFVILRALIGAKVDIDMVCDKDANTPLMNAVSQIKDKQVVQELVDHNASQTTKNSKGETAETLAKKYRMTRHLRTKAERNSSSAQVVDVVVSLVLLVISYTNSGFVKSTVRGIAKKLYNISGAETPELAKEIPKPNTVDEFKKNLSDYVRGSKFEKFFAKNDSFLETLAEKANALREDPTTDLGKPENIGRLTRLSLYQPVVLCDDSVSMELENRFKDQQALVGRIACIATRIVPDDLAGVDLRFINAAGSYKLDAKAIEPAINVVKPKGGTPIGTSLFSKILKPLVYDVISTGTLKRPILVCITTDGSPSGEPMDKFKKTILDCKLKLDAAGYDPTSVMFLVSQIGSDEFATDFLQNLRMEHRIKDVLYCTSNRLDDKFRELKENERMLESWLLHVLTKPIMERHMD